MIKAASVLVEAASVVVAARSVQMQAASVVVAARSVQIKAASVVVAARSVQMEAASVVVGAASLVLAVAYANDRAASVNDKVRFQQFFTHKTNKDMTKKYFFPHDGAGRMMWFKNLVAKLPAYQQRYNLRAEDVQELVNSEAAMVYWVGYNTLLQEYARSMAEYIKALQSGDNMVPLALAAPQRPAFAQPGFTPTFGMFNRAVAMGNSIKKNIAYNLVDGKDLGLEGETTNLDLLTIKPTIGMRLIAGGHPEMVWKKQGMDGIEIHKDNGNGQFVMFAYDSHPNYTDNSPLPAQGANATWNYKAIYRLDDEQIGLWSDVASINVMS